MNLTLNYLTLRKFIGIVGILLPIALLSTGERPSISNYWYSDARDVLVGGLSMIAAFLMTYQGYDSRDRNVSIFAGLMALVIAGVPHQHPYYAWVHFAAALIFGLCLVYTAGYLFVQSDRTYLTPRKRQRNMVYRACAIVMLLAMIGGFLGLSIFWAETIAIEAFGIAWLVKGEMILKDLPEDQTKV